MTSINSSQNNIPMAKPYRLGWKEMGEYRQDQINKVIELTQRFGPVVHITMMGIPLYFISQPNIIREILVRHPNQQHKDRFTTHMFKRFLGEGIFIVEDERWRQQRKLLQPIFQAKHIRDFTEIFANQTREMCNQWRIDDSYQLEQEMMALTLRIICQTMFSEDITGLESKMGEYIKVITVEAQSQLKFGLTIPNWVPLPTYRRQNRAINGVQQLLRTIIHKRQQQLQDGEPVPSDLLTMLLSAQYEDGQPMSDAQVMDECLTIFFAGHETTALGLTWAWAELLQHPDILQRLSAEVDQKLGSRAVTYEDLVDMPYLSQVVKETLRLHPPAAALARDVIEPFEANGYHFEQGDTLVVHINTLHRQPDFYPEPDRFNPDRFGPEQEQPDRYTYMPFGAGPRICIGNAFATLEMEIILATMLQSLQLSLLPDQEFVPELLITLRPQDGVQVKVESSNIT